MSLKCLLFVIVSLNWFACLAQQDKVEQFKIKIDSIAKVHGINKGRAVFFGVTTFNDKVGSDEVGITRVKEFKVQGSFLIIDHTFFHLSDLVYFKFSEGTVEPDHLEFCFGFK